MPVASEEEDGIAVVPAVTEEAGDERLKVPGTGPRSCRVQKCLFGEVDRDANRLDTIRIREALAESNKRKWNFDFARGCPLEGQYQWTRVDCGQPLSTTDSSSLTLEDCSPTGEGLAGCATFDLGVGDESLTIDATTEVECGISDAAAEDSTVHATTNTHPTQPTLRKYFRVKKQRLTHKHRTSK